MIWKKFCLIFLLLLICLVPLSAGAQNLEQVGKTDVGILFVDTDNVQSVKQDGIFYLAVLAYEKFTDAEYLQALREDEDLAQATGAVYMYLFDNRGANYCIASHYIVDAETKICVDLGVDMRLQSCPGNKTLLEAYTKALKALENKNRWRKKW